MKQNGMRTKPKGMEKDFYHCKTGREKGTTGANRMFLGALIFSQLDSKRKTAYSTAPSTCWLRLLGS